MNVVLLATLSLFLSEPTLGEQRRADYLERLETVLTVAERHLCWAEGVNAGVRSRSIARGYPGLARAQLNIRMIVGAWRRTARDFVESTEDALEGVQETHPSKFEDEQYYRDMMNELEDTEEIGEDSIEEMENLLHEFRRGPSMGIDMDALRKECDGEED